MVLNVRNGWSPFAAARFGFAVPAWIHTRFVICPRPSMLQVTVSPFWR
jgi:hypothetical protein